MNYKQRLLDKLLDKFERSRAYLDESTARRRIMIRLSAEFPEYDIEKSETRSLVNSIVHDLAEQGTVGYDWLPHENGNILSRVWLRLDNLPCAYESAGRTPKKDKVNTILSMVLDCSQSAALPWLHEFLSTTRAAIEARRRAAPLLPDDVEQARAVLTALQGINDRGGEECLERAFSLQYFGNSKYFENNVRGKVASIIRKYLVDEDGDLDAPSDDEVLSQVGLVRSPEQIEFSGSMVGKLTGNLVDFSAFKHGATINSPTVADLEIISLPSVKKILFIENKANYLNYIFSSKSDDELVIFHGGFYSPARGAFFQKVYETGHRDGVEFRHWSDIDLGGFRIFCRLQSSIIPELMPHLMDREAFISRRQHWVGFGEKYQAELKKLLELPEYAQFHGVIQLMIAEKAKLEQEAFLLS
jgi:hypothetical protein